METKNELKADLSSYILTCEKRTLTDEEKTLLASIFQSYYCEGIKEIALKSEMMNSILRKTGLLDEWE